MPSDSVIVALPSWPVVIVAIWALLVLEVLAPRREIHILNLSFGTTVVSYLCSLRWVLSFLGGGLHASQRLSCKLLRDNSIRLSV